MRTPRSMVTSRFFKDPNSGLSTGIFYGCIAVLVLLFKLHSIDKLNSAELKQQIFETCSSTVFFGAFFGAVMGFYNNARRQPNEECADLRDNLLLIAMNLWAIVSTYELISKVVIPTQNTGVCPIEQNTCPVVLFG